MWPSLKLVNGRPRHPQSQGSVEKGNDSLKKTLNAWMKDNNSTNWSKGIFFTQWALNTTMSDATKVVPYRSMFGITPKIGLATKLQPEFLVNIGTGILEEDLEELNEEQLEPGSIKDPSENDLNKEPESENEPILEIVAEINATDNTDQNEPIFEISDKINVTDNIAQLIENASIHV